MLSRRLIAAVLMLLSAGVGGYWLVANRGSGIANVVYETSPVGRGQIRKTVATSGPVRALVTVSVGSQLSGQVERVNVDFNSAVKPGDVLATLDAKTYTARVTQARADLAVAEAALVNQDAALKRNIAIEKLARQSVARQQALAAKGFSSQQTLDQATRDVDVAGADIAVANAQIVSAMATIEQKKASLRQAEIDLERATIRAPIEGTVISRTVDPGQTVAASLQAPELFKIAQDLSRVRIEAQVNEADVGAIAEGNPATFTVDAYPDQRFDGRVAQVRLAATEINNVVTYTVIIEASNVGRKLFPGMTANVSIIAATREGVLRIANDALRYKPKADPKAVGAGAAGRADRTARVIERLKGDVALSAEQEASVKAALTKLGEELRAGGGGGFGGAPADPSVFRQKASLRISEVLSPTLTEEQKVGFQRWLQGREQTKGASIWVLGTDGVPERRQVRVGIADDQWTEIVGGELVEGERVIFRAKEQKI